MSECPIKGREGERKRKAGNVCVLYTYISCYLRLSSFDWVVFDDSLRFIYTSTDTYTHAYNKQDIEIKRGRKQAQHPTAPHPSISPLTRPYTPRVGK